MAANDNLEGLIDVRRELQRNSDIIQDQVQQTGKLGMEFMGVLNLSKRLNSALTASVEAQADMSNLIQTYEKSMKSVNELKRQQDIITRELRSKEKSLNTQQQKSYQSVLLGLEAKKKAEERIGQLREELSRESLTDQQEIAKVVQKIQQQEILYQAITDNVNKKLADRNVAMALFLKLQKDTVDEGVKLNT